MIEATKIREFWASVDRTSDPEGCWPWLGWKDETGRGRYKLDGRTTTAPRVALLLKVGPPEDPEHQACNSCDNPSCCKPAHLSWSSKSNNMREMGRKGRAGIQRHPERYKRLRRPDVKYRPVKQRGAPSGIDSRTDTRYATSEEVELAKKALLDLEQNRNSIILAPAPDPHFEGHKIRVVESRNPGWYIRFGAKYWSGPRRFVLKRDRVIRALNRVVKGRVRGNGYDKDLLEWLKNEKVEPRA